MLLFCRILHGNNLIGIIPKELGMLKHLRVLDLGMNQITGPIPPEFGNLTSLVKMLVTFDRCCPQSCLLFLSLNGF